MRANRKRPRGVVAPRSLHSLASHRGSAGASRVLVVYPQAYIRQPCHQGDSGPAVAIVTPVDIIRSGVPLVADTILPAVRKWPVKHLPSAVLRPDQEAAPIFARPRNLSNSDCSNSNHSMKGQKLSRVSKEELLSSAPGCAISFLSFSMVMRNVL